MPSSQLAPSPTFVRTQPVALSQLSRVHGLLSLQSSGAPDRQVLPWHVSPALQALPSLHAAPAGRGVCAQPVSGVQLSAVQSFWSLQSIAWPAQSPAAHASFDVQAFASLQAKPSGSFCSTHRKQSAAAPEG